MSLEKFKECLEPTSSKITTFEGWFYNAETQLPFDLPDYYLIEKSQECLKEIYRMWRETGSTYYWFTRNGELVSDEEWRTLNSIKVNKIKLRDYKLSLIGI